VLDDYEGKFLFHSRAVRFDSNIHYQLHGAPLGFQGVAVIRFNTVFSGATNLDYIGSNPSDFNHTNDSKSQQSHLSAVWEGGTLLLLNGFVLLTRTQLLIIVATMSKIVLFETESSYENSSKVTKDMLTRHFGRL
jgi:hypothetical protein